METATITQIIQILGVFISGLTIGVGFGYKFANKTVTSESTYCNTPDNRQGRIGIKMIFANGKASGVTCYYKQKNNLCECTSEKCKYI